MTALDALFSLEPESDARAWLEPFLSRALADAGVWSSPRTSDGILSCRVVERTRTRVRMCGRIWQIDQTPRTFFLDVARGHALGAPPTWTLYVDIDLTSLSPRRARHVLDSIQDPTDVPWLITITGSA